MIVITTFVLFQIFSISNGLDVRNCSTPLITQANSSGFRVITPLGSSPIPEIGTNNYWQLKDDLRVVELEFLEPYYVASLAIQVNTKKDSPCNFVESEINLRDYELIIDNKRVNIAKRNKINKTFIKVSFTPIYAKTIQIRRTSPLSDPTFLCIQYQLYGCMEMPTDCTPLISYDYSQPITRDDSYTGECKNNWCSGGLGILTDSNYSNYLRWKDSVTLSLSFYQQVGISDISIFFNHSNDIQTDSIYKRVPMESGTLVLNVNKVLDVIEFNLNSTSVFIIEEIKIMYWRHGTEDNIEIPCYLMVAEGEGTFVRNMVIITVAVGIVLFAFGLITPFIIWFIKQKNYFRCLRCRGNNLENNNKPEKTEHFYTDVHSKASTNDIKLLTHYSIQEHTGIRPDIPVSSQGDSSPSLTAALETQVKSMSLDRRNKENIKEFPGLMKSETFMEDNSLYQSRSISKKNELRRFENLERTDSEIFVNENPHYVTSEAMRMSTKAKTTTTTPTPSTPPKTEVSYENTEITNGTEAEEFVTYDKLNHI